MGVGERMLGRVGANLRLEDLEVRAGRGIVETTRREAVAGFMVAS